MDTNCNALDPDPQRDASAAAADAPARASCTGTTTGTSLPASEQALVSVVQLGEGVTPAPASESLEKPQRGGGGGSSSELGANRAPAQAPTSAERLQLALSFSPGSNPDAGSNPHMDGAAGPGPGRHAHGPPRRPGLLRAAKRRARAAVAPLLSIRSLFIVSAVLQVLGAVAVVFCIMWYLGQGNVDSLTRGLVTELQKRADGIIHAYLTNARQVCEYAAVDFSSGHLIRDSWRRVLEAFAGTLDNVKEIALSAVSFADGWYVASERCGASEPGCGEGRRAVFGNATHFMYYEAGRRGQPKRHLSTTVLTPLARSWFNATLRSPTASTWFGIRYAPMPDTLTTPDPLDGLVISYSKGFAIQEDLENIVGPSGALPGTLGGTPTSAPATPDSFFASPQISSPLVGAIAVNMRLGALSRQLQEAIQVPGTLLLLTNGQGRVVATSTRELSHVVDGRMRGVEASTSPHALTRDLVAQVAGEAPGGTRTFWCGGEEFFGSRIPVRMEPDLDWTMTNVYAELRLHVDPSSMDTDFLNRRRSRNKPRSRSSSSSSNPHQSAIRELTAFDDLVADMHHRFVSFQEVVSAEAKMKIEMEVRSEETKKFLATVSHEMRTPLNGMLGMLDLARECALPADAAEYVEAASLSGDHLLSLVK
eukprot:tig00021015_g17164.t1